MDITPYIFRTANTDPFSEATAKLKNAYFWAQVLEVGSGVQHGSICHPNGTSEYYLVEQSPTIMEEVIFTAEEFLQLLIGHSFQGKYFGYSWTIHEMAEEWHQILREAFPEQKEVKVDNYALRIDHKERTLCVVFKEEAWQQINQLPF